MYLVNVHSERLEHFIEDPPPYAILSHRWGSEELEFKDVFKRRINRSLEGYAKFFRACGVARNYDLDYLWIDTCCIDKRSSAELSEAINSMFSWYSKAEVCLAFLQDVVGTNDLESSFANSVWFTRSWTLQELIAPDRVVFFNRTWDEIGDKHSMAASIRQKTGIPRSVLNREASLWNYSIAEKMSWAAERTATRTEDIAYSLMGIFDVNMPLLYGEGKKAFLRLQEEIVRHTHDLTFLMGTREKANSSLFADDPIDFAGRDNQDVLMLKDQIGFTLNNVGLEIETDLIRHGFGVYHILIAAAGNGDEHVVLLRKHKSQRAFYRVGIATIPLDNTINATRSQQIVIMRGTVQQGVTERDVRQAYNTFDFGLNVHVAAAFPVLNPGTSFVRWANDEPAWNGKGHKPSRLKCSFVSPLYAAWSKIKCRISESVVLWFDVTLDFECRPCVLVRQDLKGSKVRKAHDRTKVDSVYELSARLPQYQAQGRYVPGTNETELTPVLDDSTGDTFCFLRSEGHSKFAQVPTSLTTTSHPVWLYLIRPRDRINPTNLWLLKLEPSYPSPEERESFVVNFDTGNGGPIDRHDTAVEVWSSKY